MQLAQRREKKIRVLSLAPSQNGRSTILIYTAAGVGCLSLEAVEYVNRNSGVISAIFHKTIAALCRARHIR